MISVAVTKPASMTFLTEREAHKCEGEVSKIQGSGVIYGSYPKQEHLSGLKVQVAKEKPAIKEAFHELDSKLKASDLKALDLNAIDLNRISDRVCSIIERKLKTERERRGIFG